MIKNALLILDASLYVAQNGELVATNDNNRYFPVDGFVEELINETDDTHIQPFQTTYYGIQHYFKSLCTADSVYANGNDGTESGGSREDKSDSNTELIIDLDEVADGCISAPTFAFVLFLIIILRMACNG